jgi:Flp pilus assembly protein TadB
MTQNLPARQEHGELVVDTVHDLHPDHHDPHQQEGRQNLGVALLPLALIALLLLAFVAAAWTFLAAQPPV